MLAALKTYLENKINGSDSLEYLSKRLLFLSSYMTFAKLYCSIIAGESQG